MKELSPYFSKDSFDFGIEYRGAYFALDGMETIKEPEALLLRSSLLGSKDIYLMPLIKGVSFCYCRIHSKDQVSVLENPGKQPKVTLSFLIEGHLKYDIQPKARHKINSGFAFIDAPVGERTYNIIHPHNEVLSVDFHFDKSVFLNYFHQMVECEIVSADYKAICLSLNRSKAPKVPFSPDMHHLFLQILHCPFHGAQRRLYFEAKITEVLLHYFFEMQKIVGSQKFSHPILSADDKNKLFFLKDYLKKNAASALTLAELSSMMGMSETSVQIKFKELFGYTIIQYHRKQSLKIAYDFLQNGESIKNATYFCGYSSLASFSKAFYNAFGIRPSKLKK